jgi:flagellar assembly factor FliW
MSQQDVLRVPTSRFGEVEIAADTVLTFPQGLVGMPQLRRFALIDGRGPFRWMQSLDDPDATFVVIDSDEVVSDYEIHPATEELRLVMEPDEPVALCALLVVTVPRDEPERITANLMAPLLVNPERRLGVQAVLTDRYPVRHPLVFAKSAGGEAVKAG